VTLTRSWFETNGTGTGIACKFKKVAAAISANTQNRSALVARLAPF